MVDTKPRNSPGYLFVLEGIDGAGKTVACDAIVTLLQSDGFDVVRLREPTSESKWGREIRERSPRGELSPAEELELYTKDRDWHIQNRIRPALESGKMVLMDRYFFASGAYQSESTGIDWREILRRNREELHAPEPDIIFILDIIAEEGLKRATARKEAVNLQFERLDRLLKVRETYLVMAAEDSGTYQIIDATLEIDAVVQAVYTSIRDYVTI